MNDPDYTLPGTVEQKVNMASDPVIGELYQHLVHDYRWWGLESRYNKFKTYFDVIRHREIHRMYEREPLEEFFAVIEKAGEKESWTVLPHTDKYGNTYTAYPPGVEPPRYRLDGTGDKLPLSPYDTKIQESGQANLFFRELLDPIEFREEADLSRQEDYLQQLRDVHSPYWRGEAIVPDITTHIPPPLVLNEGNPLSRYAALDQVAVDQLFTPKRPIGDLSLAERAKAPVDEAHRAEAWTSRSVDQAATWGEQSVLRQLYERSLYAHHVAGLVALEQGKEMPSPPLPDSRLSRASLTEARKRFTIRLATLNELNYPFHDLSDPLVRQKYQASIGAYVHAGQESGFLPADVDQLPQIFQDALQALRRADFILERNSALALAKKGHEDMMRMRAEILSSLDSPQHVNVHWSGPDARYEVAPSNELWEKVGLNSAASGSPSAISSATSSSLAPAATDAAIKASTSTSSTAPSTLSKATVLSKLSGSHGQFDWLAFNQAVNPEKMTASDFDVACEAMLQAFDLQHQAAAPAADINAALSAHSASLSLTPTERLAHRHLKITSQLAQFDAANPRPTLSKKHTGKGYEVYEKLVATWLKEREAHLRKLLKEYPISLPPVSEVIRSMEVPSTEGSAQLQPTATWGDALAQRAYADTFKFCQSFFEFLQRDAANQLQSDEVTAFAFLYEDRLGLTGLTGSKESRRAQFIEAFRPYSSFTKAELVRKYPEESVENGIAGNLDTRARVMRAKGYMRDLEAVLRTVPGSPLPHVTSHLKTTQVLEEERRAGVTEFRQVSFETMLMQTEQEFKHNTEILETILGASYSDYTMRMQYRNYAAIQTDPEFKYMGERSMFGVPEHLPLPKPLHWPARIITALERVFIKMPQYYGIHALAWWRTNFGWQNSWLRTMAIKASGIDLNYNAYASALPLDPLVSHRYHPYYRHTLYRLYYFLHAQETAHLSPEQRINHTISYVPTWSAWHLERLRMRWTNRLAGMVSTPARFLLLPFVAMTTIATVAVLEQRDTWAHDLIRAKPEGLEVSPQERRRWLQKQLPIWAKHGPKPIFFGELGQPADFQDAPYLHRANSSNAADFKLIGE